jgi:hypothetical protein
MEKYAAVLVGYIRMGPCNDFPELDHLPSDISADTMAHVGFPVEMFIMASLCTRSTIKCLGTQGATEPALKSDIDGGCRWSSSRCWKYSRRGQDIR